MEKTTTIWNSLEIIKLIISCFTPIIVAILAYMFNKRMKDNDKKHWTNQKIIEKRIVVYDIIVPKLNDLLCYYSYVGNWKELTPKEVIDTKRFLDKQVYIYAPLFTKEVLEKYSSFINLCFEKFTGWGNDAKIYSMYKRRQDCQENWKEEWKNCFSEKYTNSRQGNDNMIRQDIEEIRTHYLELLEEIKKNLEIYKSGIYPKNEFPSINF